MQHIQSETSNPAVNVAAHVEAHDAAKAISKTAAGLAKLLRPQKQLSNAVQCLLDLMQTRPGLSKQNVIAWSQMPVQTAKLVQILFCF